MDIIRKQYSRLKRVIKEECQRKYDLIVWEVIRENIKGWEQNEIEISKEDY